MPSLSSLALAFLTRSDCLLAYSGLRFPSSTYFMATSTSCGSFCTKTSRVYAFRRAAPMPFLFQNAIIERLKSRSAAVRLSVYVPARRPAPVRRRPAFGAITVQLPQDRQSLCRRVVECKTATGRDGANPGNEGSSKTKRWRVTMRGVAVPYAVLAAVLVLNAAVAQNDPGQPSSPSRACSCRIESQDSQGPVNGRVWRH